MNELRNDKNLHEAVSRREQQLPPLPADLNERLMQRLEESATASKSRRLWLYAAIAVAASIALLIVFNFGKLQTAEEPLAYQGDGSSDTTSTIVDEPASVDAPTMTDVPVYQKNRPHDTKKKQRKVVMKLVDLIPTSEAEPVLTATESAPEAEIITEQDPLVAMTAQLEDIRSRGQRLQQEITALMNN